MKKAALIIGILGLFFIFGLTAFLVLQNSGDFHLREFQKIKTNFNHYQPSFFDRIEGIHNNQEKWDFELRRLEDLGAVQHKKFVFTEIPFTKETSARIWQSANSNFPNAVMFTGNYYATNQAGYGTNPIILNVWDIPAEIERWNTFFKTNNQPQ